MDVDDTTPGFDIFDESAEVRLDVQAPWVAGVAPSDNTSSHLPNCTSCVTRVAEVDVEITQKGFNFYYYPFDVQVRAASG